jgi:hypothetical protein
MPLKYTFDADVDVHSMDSLLISFIKRVGVVFE